MSTNTLRPDRVAREPERERITGVPTSSWYDLQDKGLAPKQDAVHCVDGKPIGGSSL